MAPRGSERIASGRVSSAERNVDEEHQAPAGAPEVGVDERAGEDRRGEHRPDPVTGPNSPVALSNSASSLEDLLHQAKALRDHERPEGALEHPEGDEDADVRRQRHRRPRRA